MILLWFSLNFCPEFRVRAEDPLTVDPIQIGLVGSNTAPNPPVNVVSGNCDTTVSVFAATQQYCNTAGWLEGSEGTFKSCADQYKHYNTGINGAKPWKFYAVGGFTKSKSWVN